MTALDTASINFVLFGLAAAAASNLSRARLWRSAVLLVASLSFLAMLDPHPLALCPLAGFLVLGYAALWAVQRGWSRALPAFVAAVILAYIWLKRYTFLPDSVLIRSPYLTLGLSYIFFRVLHLIIEAAGDRDSTRIGPLEYLLYTVNFTTLLSGPIERYDDFARDQFAEQPLPLDAPVVGLELERIIRGFFKVNVLAVLLHSVQLSALEDLLQPADPSERILAAFRLAVVYPFFLYANFSGYIDIVIALARLMRIRLAENFNRPFSASSFIDFWNRWHITLSVWLKTYVYNPLLLALMRRIPALALQPSLGVASFFVTFFLVGIWHGRTPEFAVFGVLQGGGVAINKLWQLALAGILGRKRYKALAAHPVYIGFARGLTFSWFALTLFWFWGTSGQIRAIFLALGTLGWMGVWLAVWLAATVVLALWERLRRALLSVRTTEGPVLTSRYARVVYASALALIALVIGSLLSQPAPAIVYKAF